MTKSIKFLFCTPHNFYYQMRNICQRNFNVQFYLRFLYLRFPHLRCLHADSITRAIDMMYFTRCFHYLRNPYPQNDHYPQFHYTRIKSPHLYVVARPSVVCR